MRWLITGGCGFIGRNLVKALRDGGGEGIRILDNQSTGNRAELEAICPVVPLDSVALKAVGPRPTSFHVELVNGDIRDGELCMRAAKGFDVLAHLAADTGVATSVADPIGSCIVNVIGTVNCLEAARQSRVKRFIFASSGAPIGECEPPLHEELPAHPVSPYGASKLSGEAYCSAYMRAFGLETVGLRFSNVYGPLSAHKGSVVAKFIREAISGEPWETFGDGTQTRDFLYVDDLVEAILLAAIRPSVGGEVFQIATARETSVNELADYLKKILASHGIRVPAMRRQQPRVGDVKRNFSDTSKAQRLLDWRATTSLNDGLETTVNWFLSQP